MTRLQAACANLARLSIGSASPFADRARRFLAQAGFQYCRCCGCSDLDGCAPEPCHWYDDDLCSICATKRR